jgi:hypothetical protein
MNTFQRACAFGLSLLLATILAVGLVVAVSGVASAPAMHRQGTVSMTHEGPQMQHEGGIIAMQHEGPQMQHE